MENIILFGAGKGIEWCFYIIEKYGGFLVKEIWDNSLEAQGKKFSCAGQDIIVSSPHIVDDIHIVIDTHDFENEIR